MGRHFLNWSYFTAIIFSAALFLVDGAYGASTPTVITITAPASAGQSTVASGATTSLSVSASVNQTAGSVNYHWTSSCSGGLGDGTVIIHGDNTASWLAPQNATQATQTCQITVTVTYPQAADVSSSVTVSVLSDPPILILNSGHIANVVSVDSGGTVPVNVTATYNVPGGTISYAWAATCQNGIGGGTFQPANSPSSTWTAPINQTGNNTQCNITITATGSVGGSASGFTSIGVTSTAVQTRITSQPSASQSTVASGGVTKLSVTATTTRPGNLGYSWIVTCPGLGGGSYDNNLQANATYTAPGNLTGKDVTCVVKVNILDSSGAQTTASTSLVVQAVPPVITITRDVTFSPSSPVDLSQGSNLNVVSAQLFADYNLPGTLSLTWTVTCTGGLGSGSFEQKAYNSMLWRAVINTTKVNQTCTFTAIVTGSLGGSATSSGVLTLLPVTNAMVLTQPLTATALQVDPGNKTSLSAKADPVNPLKSGFPGAYAWSSTCTGGLDAGSFVGNDPASSNFKGGTQPDGSYISLLGAVDWTAPNNTTGQNQTCTLSLEARGDDTTNSAYSSLTITVTGGITPQAGWWYNPSESGRGYSIEVNNGRIFLAAYMYRDDGTPVWYIADEKYAASGFNGTLFDVTGTQTLGSTGGGTTALGPTSVKVSGTFSTATQGVLTLTGGPLGANMATIPLTRFPIDGTSVKPPVAAGAPQTGWWYNAQESGVGYFIEFQGGQVFFATYFYGPDQRDLWYIALNSAIQSSPTSVSMTGSLLQVTGGQTLTSGVLKASSTAIGQITLQFSSATSGIITLPSGRQVPISRFTTF